MENLRGKEGCPNELTQPILMENSGVHKANGVEMLGRMSRK